MDPVIIAVGSNVGSRHKHIKKAGKFLSTLSKKPVRASSIYLTEPVGPATRYFLNAVVEIQSALSPKELISKLKGYEKDHGRPANQPRWSARTIDLDIIAFGHLVIQEDNLIIPHPEYNKRLFVLKPLKDIHPVWSDPKSKIGIGKMLEAASKIQIRKTNLVW